MCQRMITILFLVCAFCIGGSAYGQKVNYQQFENIYLGAEASVISCFLQDSEGLIWIGSNKGLFSYDGYSTQQHFTYGERNNTRIYCGIIADNTCLQLPDGQIRTTGNGFPDRCTDNGASRRHLMDRFVERSVYVSTQHKETGFTRQ